MTTEETGFNPAARSLCPDGSCLGIIKADGRCNICGRQGERAAAGQNGLDNGHHHPGDLDDGLHSIDAGDMTEMPPPVAVDGTALDASPPDFDPDRRLCEDGTCVGVVGATGGCTVCGRVSS